MSVSEGLSQMCCSTTVVHQSDNFSSYFPCKFDDCQFGKFRSIYLWARLNGLNFLTLSGELRHAVIAGKQKKELALTWTFLLSSQKFGGSDPIFWGKTNALHSWVHGWDW